MADTTVTLTWTEDLNKMLEEKVKEAAVDYLRDDPKFKQIMSDAVKEVSAKLTTISKDAVASAMKEDVAAAIGRQNTALKNIINQCLVDYKTFATQHASDYANRRFTEVNAALDKAS